MVLVVSLPISTCISSHGCRSCVLDLHVDLIVVSGACRAHTIACTRSALRSSSALMCSRKAAILPRIPACQTCHPGRPLPAVPVSASATLLRLCALLLQQTHLLLWRVNLRLLPLSCSVSIRICVGLNCAPRLWLVWNNFRTRKNKPAMAPNASAKCKHAVFKTKERTVRNAVMPAIICGNNISASPTK